MIEAAKGERKNEIAELVTTTHMRTCTYVCVPAYTQLWADKQKGSVSACMRACVCVTLEF